MGHRPGDASPAAQLLGPSQLPVHEDSPPPPQLLPALPHSQLLPPFPGTSFSIALPAPAFRRPPERPCSPSLGLLETLPLLPPGWMRTVSNGAVVTPWQSLGLGRKTSTERAFCSRTSQGRTQDRYPCQKRVVLMKIYTLERNKQQLPEVFGHQQGLCWQLWRGDKDSLRLLRDTPEHLSTSRVN